MKASELMIGDWVLDGGVKASTIQKIEQGQISLPLDILAKVANVLNLKIELNAL